MMPQGGQPRSNPGFPEFDMASDWVTLHYLGNGSGHPERRLQTPFLSGPPLPLLPPKPIEPTSTGVPSSTKLPNHVTPNPLTITKDMLPSFYDQQLSLSTQLVHSQHLPVVSPPNEALEPPAPNPLDKTPKSPKHVLQDDLHESPVISLIPTQAVGGHPTTKALGLIAEGFNKITEIIEGLAEVTGKPPSNLYRRLEKSQKGALEGHLWNIYLHYFVMRRSLHGASTEASRIPPGLH
jgi:hypothetical protein